MRLLFVNYMHPDVPHVSGMRLHYFAKALARRGHQIVLLTRSKDDESEPLSLQTVETELRNHDWASPYHLPTQPINTWSLRKIRDPASPRLMRQLLILWNYPFGKGLFSDWSAGSRIYWPLLAKEFRPQVTWGTFGNVDAWVVARGIAKEASADWVMDVKDGWESFIPRGFRHILAWRFQDAAAMTANSQFFGEQFEQWFPHNATVIYSGADDNWFKAKEQDDDAFQITMIGSVYSDEHLERFLAGLEQWVNGLPEIPNRRIRFSYAGGDNERVRLACKTIEKSCEIEIYGYLPQETLAELCQSSTVNVYIWQSSGFHHKVLELLCARRPIISFPGEHEEARALAAEVAGQLYACEDSPALIAALDEICNKDSELIEYKSKLKQFSWTYQAELLERVFETAVSETENATT